MRYFIFIFCILLLFIVLFPLCAPADDHYAAQNGQAPSAPYTAWSSAASNIQDAIDKAATNDTVWVGAGRYTVPPNFTNYIGTNVVFINKPLTLRSSNGVPASTIIDGEGKSRGVAAFYLTTTTNRFIIDGFTITNCYATNMGGGILFNSDNSNRWTGVVYNCIICNNLVEYGSNSSSFLNGRGARGGGIGQFAWNLVGFGLVITNCVIRNNKTDGPQQAGYGGGIYTAGFSTFYMSDCLIEGNVSESGGGAYLGWSRSWVENCVFRNNAATNNFYWQGGGGLALAYPSAGSTDRSWVRNCLIYNNSARGGGGMYVSQGILNIYNCTIVSNRMTADGGGGIWQTYAYGGLRVMNSVIYSNSGNSDLTLATYTNNFFTNICVYSTNNLLGEGNFTNSPGFADWAGKNFRLAPGSPCVNRGFNQDWATNGIDLDGRRRIRYGTVDIGAYELIQDGTIYRFR
jgi:hypothetical protein